MQHIFIVFLIFTLLLLKLKKKRSFKFINFIEQKKIRKKVQQKVNINKKIRI